MRYLRILSVILIFWGLFACSTSRLSIRNSNVASIYDPGTTSLHPEFYLFHQGDTVSQLYFRIFTEELLFNKANPSAEEKAQLKIQYRLFYTNDNGKMNDSASFSFSLNKKNCSNEFVSFFKIKIKPGSKAILELISSDVLRNSTHLHFIQVDKSSKYSSQNFFVTHTHSPAVQFHSFYPSSDSITISNPRANPVSYHIQYYREYSKSPQPPFSLTSYNDPELKPDSVWVVKTKDEQLNFRLKYRGIYHFLADTVKSAGLTLYNFGDFFPLVKTTGEMIRATRYITTNKEFKKLESEPNEKQAVDSFWLKSSGNINRAKELIRVYYSRVTFANIYFTSFMAGWLTDRGMIYIIFGPPKTIFKTDDSERWIYGDNKNLMSMDFYFQKLKSDFSENYYVLKRGDIYKTSWYQATDTWRNGRIYSVGN